MRHRKSGRQLNRNSSHRKAMFKNMAVSLIEHEVIKTTVPKAKELKRVAEPLITLAKSDSVANRRLVFARTGSKAAVNKLLPKSGHATRIVLAVIPAFLNVVSALEMPQPWHLSNSSTDHNRTMMTTSMMIWTRIKPSN